MKAVIMAGGEGTRLRPLTCSLPKPMVPILNKPMMEHIVNLLKRHNITEIASTLWYMPAEIKGYFQDGSRFGVNMEYYVETQPLGTAGSVKNAHSFLDDTFLVVSGDALTDIDLAAAAQFHQQKGAAVTLVLSRVSNPLNYGVVLIDEEGRINQFLEKPSWSEVFSDTVNTGIYILEPEIFDLVPLGEKVDFSRDLFPELLRRGFPMYGHVADGYWSDIGDLDVYRRAHRDCLDGTVSLDLPIAQKGRFYLEEGVEIHPEAEVQGPAYFGRGTRIGAHASIGPYCVFGSYNQISSRASLKRSILWSGVQVGSRAQLRGCLCAKNVRLQSNVAVYEGATLGEKVQVGSSTSIAANTKIWPEKIIPSGSKLRQSIIWGNQERSSLFSQNGIGGDFRGDLTPEAITQIGLSYAAFLGKGGRVLTTHAPTSLASLAMDALTVGLRGGGLQVFHGGPVTGKISRYAVQYLGLEGALHCNSPSNNQILIECWDGRGRPLSKADQRKLENIFLREDFPRRNWQDLGNLAPAPDFRNSYLKSLARHYRSGEPGFKIGFFASTLEPGSLGGLTRDFLGLAGYQPVERADGLPTLVIQDQNWFFLDEKGRRLTEEGWWKMFIQSLQSRDLDRVAIPINLSATVAQEAQERGLQVEWTKMEPAFWMEVASDLGVLPEGKQEIFPHIEPLASIGELLHFISSGTGQLDAGQSAGFRQSAQVHCPWEDKGRIMRQLIEATDSENTMYLDGIRVHHNSGWVLVVPDGDEPVFRIYGEAETEQEATTLVEQYVDLIKSYESKER